MSNYLKKILFTLLILGMPCMNSVSKAMNAEDYEGPNVRARTVSFVAEDQKDVQSFTKQSDAPQVVRLEDSRNSWKSYLSSSVKSVAQRAYDIVDYTTRNPQKAAIIGFVLSLQTTITAANCTCLCHDYVSTCYDNPCRNQYFFYGMQRDLAHCTAVCEDAFLGGASKCIPW